MIYSTHSKINELGVNINVWSDDKTTTQEDQEKILLPMNTLTEYISTVHPISKRNMRVFVGAPTKNIRAWVISKIQDNQAPARGVKQVTLYQHEVDTETDLIDVENREFYCDYRAVSGTQAVEPNEIPIITKLNASITSANDSLKVGGSYKLLKLKIMNGEEDVTDSYKDTIELDSWECYVDDIKITEPITWSEQADKSTIKVKFAKDSSYIGKTMFVVCNIKPNLVAKIELKLVAL